jgi:putative nucleotidyltransferase with HDIG domain
MEKKIMSLIPEFQEIQEKNLQQKTIQVWIEAIREGGWQLEDLFQMPFTLLIENTDVNIIVHTRAVTRTSMQIADVLKDEYKDRITINRDYLLAGAILHDIGKLFEYSQEGDRFVKSEKGKLLRHPISGAAFCQGFDIPSEIIHIIAAHSKEGDGCRRTVEAFIVHHADFVNFDVLKG